MITICWALSNACKQGWSGHYTINDDDEKEEEEEEEDEDDEFFQPWLPFNCAFEFVFIIAVFSPVFICAAILNKLIKLTIKTARGQVSRVFHKVSDD